MSGRAVIDRRTVHVHDLSAETDEEYSLAKEFQRRWGHHTILVTPLLSEGIPLGMIGVYRTEVRAFSDAQIKLLEIFAHQAAIAIENVRLFTELQARNRDLTATSEILRVISRSPTDVQPVFDTIAEHAMRLCATAVAAVSMFDGSLIHLSALANVSREGVDSLQQAFPVAPGRGSAVGRVILTGDVVEIPDVLSDPEYQLTGPAHVAKFRCALGVPMLHQGRAIGVIAVGRSEPGTFSEEQIQLLKTFADQAVIAIENVRLFKELQARTGELTQSVEKLTALGEVSRAVSSTLDVETVLDTIVSRATQLAGADGCAISEYDDATELFHVRATHGIDATLIGTLRAMPLRKGEGVMGRAAETREPIQMADIA
ncbi:MAG TPA: GAF domain-containing protein, partial [Vicinamibacterales bacterium]|nr:GAF domain-containing protein [Vicinamibacterales bacterium]